MKFIVAALMLFLSLAASATLKRDNGYQNPDDYCWTSDVGRCYEVLGIAEGCGFDAATYTSTVDEHVLLKCICSACGFASALAKCYAVIPEEYSAEFKGTFDHLCDPGYYSLKERDLSPRDVGTDLGTAFGHFKN